MNSRLYGACGMYAMAGARLDRLRAAGYNRGHMATLFWTTITIRFRFYLGLGSEVLRR